MSDIVKIVLEINVDDVEFVTIDWDSGTASIGIQEANPIDTKDFEAIYKIIESKRAYLKKIDDIAAKLMGINTSNSPVLDVDLDGRKYCECT